MAKISSVIIICLSCLMGYAICQNFNPTPRNQRPTTTTSVVLPRSLSASAVAEAFATADENLQVQRQMISSRRRPIDPRRDVPSSRHNLFQRSKARATRLQTTQERFEEATKVLMEEYELSPEQIRAGLSGMNLENALRDNSVQQCQSLFNFTCRQADPFRTYDGTCNNLQHPSWGMAASCFERLVDPFYSDGVSLQRVAVSGRPLPGPRTISLEIHNHMDNPTDYVTHMFMQWGQFLDHDISQTPLSTGPNNEPLNCCPVAEDNPPQCDPIILEADDPFYSEFDIECLNNARSSICSTCALGPRQQTNQLTSVIDASHVYGNSINESRRLRTLDGTGRLRSVNDADSGELLPENSQPDNDGCSFQDTNLNCFEGGDIRINQHPALTSFHTVFLRQHNRIAGLLRALNSRWDDDRIFEETRRIVGAQMQVITYNEYLPLVIGPERMEWFDLTVQRSGYTQYDPTVQPTLINEFSTAAFRFGHSMVNTYFPTVTSTSNTVNRLRDTFLFPFGLYNGALDGIMRGMCQSPSQKLDRWMVRDVTNHLYQTRGNISSGLDLASLNIKRGRDHGMPPYTEMVRFCGGPDIQNFRDLDRLFQRGYRQIFQRIYESVDDIDLFSGGLAERPNQGAVIGPTFTCVIGIQFYHLKYGDRFYFEHGGQAGSFQREQLNNLKRTTFAKIICENTDIAEIQPNVMLYPSNRNREQMCEDLPDIDIRLWRD